MLQRFNLYCELVERRQKSLESFRFSVHRISGPLDILLMVHGYNCVQRSADDQVDRTVHGLAAFKLEPEGWGVGNDLG